MNCTRRAMLAFLAAGAGAMLVPAVRAQAPARPAYSELNPPMPVDAGGKIEVVEFFWYGCIHCYNLEPNIEAWLKRLPPDVQFRRIPAVFSNRLAQDAAIYYAFEALGLVDKLHRPFFDAIHKDALKTDNREALAQWLQKHGVDPKKFEETVRSFSVQSRVKRATQLTVASKIDGTPAMAVNGRYTVSAEQAGSREGFIQTVEHLVQMVRKQR